MGVYRAAIVTESGQNLIAQALANETPLIFTSAKTSSYSYPVGTNVPALTGLQDVVQSVMPFDSKVLGGNVAQVSVRFDNDGVDQTYRIETIGLYAKIEGGTETLFSVTQATTPDEMPVQSDVSPSAYIYNIQHTVQNASQITLTVNPAGTATVQDIMDIESPEFDDSGTVEGISSFPSFLETMKSKMNFFQFFRNLKAGLQFVLHAGQIVNNCVTDNAGLPLSAAQGKALMDKYTQLYSEVGDRFYRPTSEIDFNNLLVSGYYIGKLSKNTPDGTTSANWIIEVQAFDNNPNYVYQRATRASDKRTFTRYREGYNDIGWKDWEISATKSDLTALTDIILTPENSYSFNADYTYGYKRAGWVEFQFSLASAFDLNKDRILSIPNGCLPKKQVWFPVYESSGGNVIARGNIVGSNIYINGSNSINGKTKLFGHVVYMSES